MNRRAILKGALGGVVGLTLPPFARDAFAQASPAVVPVCDGFVMLTGAGGNILVGGGAGALKGGRQIELPERTTISNLHLTLLNKAGLETKSFGDSTGVIAGV